MTATWRSVEFRLLAYYCLLLLTLGGAFSLFTLQSLEFFEAETVRTNVENRAREVFNLGSALLDQPAALRELIERRFSPGAQNRFIRISDAGVILYQSTRPAAGEFDPGAIPLPRIGGDPAAQYGALYVWSAKFVHEGSTILVESGESTRFARTIRDNLVASLLIGLPLLLAFSVLGGYVLLRHAWTPFSRLIGSAEAITLSDPHSRLPVTGHGGRVDMLAQSLNRMLDRLDSAYQHASRFSADAAHELRTPLAIIKGELEFIAEQPELGATTLEAVGTVSEEVRRLSDMTENLLTLASLESASSRAVHVPVDLLALAKETMDQMSLLAEEKRIRLIPPEGAATLVSGDRSRLKQVLVNLLDNAIKYTPNHGTVAVRLETAPRSARLHVRDTGIGIPPEHLDSVFDRFFRVSTDRGEHGAGLGLSIARSICLAHGGTLTVHSEPGRGSDFCVELPLAAG